jgi:ABC-type multidrug transport system permease subunit
MTPMEPRVIVAWIVFVGLGVFLLYCYSCIHALGIPLISFIAAGVVWIALIGLAFACRCIALGYMPDGAIKEFLRPFIMAIRGGGG